MGKVSDRGRKGRYHQSAANVWRTDRCPWRRSVGGRFSELLAEHGWEIICIDINPRSLKRCGERVPRATRIRVDPRDTTLPCATESIDLLLCVEVFEAIPTAWFISEASRTLKSNGLIVGVVNNKLSWRGYIQHRLGQRPARSQRATRFCDCRFGITTSDEEIARELGLAPDDDHGLGCRAISYLGIERLMRKLERQTRFWIWDVERGARSASRHSIRSPE
jgi:SAM-dependent methyltransferase